MIVVQRKHFKNSTVFLFGIFKFFNIIASAKNWNGPDSVGFLKACRGIQIYNYEYLTYMVRNVKLTLTLGSTLKWNVTQMCVNP